MSGVAVVNDHRQALVTLAIGDDAASLLTISEPRFKSYAARFGYDYIVLNERKIRHRLQWFKSRVNLHLEKFQIGPLLHTYERVLYMDADILVMPDAPDFCADVPPEKLGVVADPSGQLAWKRDEEMANMTKRFGELPQTVEPYFNAGVLVLSQVHRELMRFDKSHLAKGRWPDQTCLNYFSAKFGLPRQYMDARANFLPGHEGWSDTATRGKAWAVHYAGPEAKPMMLADAAK